MAKLSLDGDFRAMLEAAVAYRITEREGIPSSEARKRVRDFATYGLQSKTHNQVLAAAYDLFQPLLGASVPFLRALLGQTIVAIQNQVERGEEAEKHHER